MASNTNFNTLAAFEAIQSAGLTEAQAKRIVQTIVDSQTELATKQDLKDTSTVLKQDITDLKTELKEDIASLSWQIKGIIAMQALTLTGLGFLIANLVK